MMRNGVMVHRLLQMIYYSCRLTDPNRLLPYASYLEYAYVGKCCRYSDSKKSPESLGVKAIDPHTLQVTLTQPVPIWWIC